MPLKWFEVDGERHEVQKALTEYTLIEHYPLTYLQMVANERPWSGTPSVTQLLKGSRQAYLELTEDYAVDPDDAAFRVLGTKAHLNLETQQYQLTEVDLLVDDIKGTSDLLEPAPANRLWLTDYKTWGSFPVMRALGIEMVDVPQFWEDSGNPIVYKSGKRAGQQKTRKEPRQTNKPDYRDVQLQVNKYRIMARAHLDALGDDRQITIMRVFVVVRDGGTGSARQRGVLTNTASIQIPPMDDAVVQRYFERKQAALLGALDSGDAPPPCSEDESWQGRKCQRYCPVAEHCAKLGDNPHLGGVLPALRESIARAEAK